MATARSRRRSRCSRRSKAWSRSRRRCTPTCCRPRPLDPARAVRGAAVRHGARSAARSARSCWPGSSSSRSLGVYGIVQHPIGLVGGQSALRPRLSRRGAACRAFSCSAACSCASPAPRRSTPTWGISAPGRSAWPGASSSFRPHPQLRRPGGDRAGRRADRGQHLLSALPGAAADAADRAGDGRDRHRQPVDHHRRLFDDPPGDPARLAAAPDHQADLGGGLRPDLCRRGQLAVDDRHARPDDRLRQVRQSRRRLRHRGVGDHADDERAAVHRHARDLGLAGLRRPARSRRCSSSSTAASSPPTWPRCWTAARCRCCWLPSSTA